MPVASARLTEVPPISGSPSTQVARLYRTHRHFVYRIALRYGSGSRAWAEDVTQEVFISLLKAIDGLDRDKGLEGWLYRVTTNRCLNRLKVERFRNSTPVRWLLASQTEESVDMGEQVELRDELRSVWVHLQALPPKQSVALCMHHLDGLSMSEVGEVLGHNKSYVSKLVARAEKALHKAAGRPRS